MYCNDIIWMALYTGRNIDLAYLAHCLRLWKLLALASHPPYCKQKVIERLWAFASTPYAVSLNLRQTVRNGLIQNWSRNGLREGDTVQFLLARNRYQQCLWPSEPAIRVWFDSKWFRTNGHWLVLSRSSLLVAKMVRDHHSMIGLLGPRSDPPPPTKRPRLEWAKLNPQIWIPIVYHLYAPMWWDGHWRELL